jgi:acetylornithine/LysW-gamma-L-lysine aminotransferase
LTVIEQENLPAQAAEKGQYLIDRLSEINAPIIREVRGLGLMVGIELKQKVAPYLRALQERRILALPAGMTVIRLLPPLVITYPQLDSLVEALADVLSSELKDE